MLNPEACPPLACQSARPSGQAIGATGNDACFGARPCGPFSPTWHSTPTWGLCYTPPSNSADESEGGALDAQQCELAEALVRHARAVLTRVRALRRNRFVGEAVKLAVFNQTLAESGAELKQAFDAGYGVWGEPLNKAVQPVWNVVNRFRNALDALSSPRDKYESEYVMAELGKFLEIAACPSEDETDEFSIQVKDAITPLRTLLSPYLRSGS